MVCADHPDVQEVAARVTNRRLITYGLNPQAEVRASHLVMGPEGALFDVHIGPAGGEGETLKALALPMAGRHNVCLLYTSRCV